MDPLRQAISSAAKRAAKRDHTARLDTLLRGVLDHRLARNSTRYSALVDAWQELLPKELEANSEIVDFENGCLKVAVRNPAHRYELQLCLGGLLRQLQNHCPQAGVRRIVLTPASG